jgi:alpha-tubulin suppressor-like RCC1 family protein
MVALLALGGIAACSRESSVTRPTPWAPTVDVKLGAPNVEAPRLPRPSPPPAGATQISLGLAHGCARMSDGTAWCWGDNDKGQLGDRTTARRDGLVRVEGVEHVEEVVAGFYASCARLRDGAVQCWGGNPSGELGDGTTEDRRGPVRVLGVERAKGVVLGTNFGCALIADGTVRCWGNDTKIVPGPARTYASQPMTAQPVAHLTDATQIASSFNHVCAVRRDGSLWCWGSNFSGQLGFGTVITQRSCSIGPLEDWVTPGDTTEPQIVPNVSGVLRIALAPQRTCALLKDGSVWCSTNPVKPARHAVEGALKGAKQLSVFWPGDRGHVCGVFDGGEVRCAGTNDRGQLGDGTLSPPFEEVVRAAAVVNAVEVRSGRSSTCARTAAGEIVCWEASDTPTFAQHITPARPRRVGIE